jgi:hypothetical protein
MATEHEYLESIREMRNLMERTTRYLSLSGLAGVLVGLIAMAGIVSLYLAMDIPIGQPVSFNEFIRSGGEAAEALTGRIVRMAAIVLLLSILAEGVLGYRKARKLGLPLWDATARRMFTALAIPVAGGGIYCLSLIQGGNPDGLASASLIFYGLGLLNAGKYAVPDVGRLGLAVFATGLVAAFFPAWGLVFWGIGFGILHIVYGISIHFKYER